MSAMSREILPPYGGEDLPVAVHSMLVVLGVAANQAALAVDQAQLLSVQALASQESAHSLQGSGSHLHEVAGMLAQCADRYHDQLLVAYARIASRYAAYAARVAADVTALRRPTTSDVTSVQPSTLINDLGGQLPPLQFTPATGGSAAVQEQNAAIESARTTLTQIVQYQMFGQPSTAYDFLTNDSRREYDLVVGFPVALHDYAAVVTWAIGVMTGFDQHSDS
jgi:hypothetical protein